jgi:hypothetical protein
MSDLMILALKGLNGGLFVVAFALIGELLEPKRFSGLFSAAPSVALANLIVTVLAEGYTKARLDSEGMIVGGAAMALACAASFAVVRDKGARAASLLISVIWLVVALTTWEVVFA